jgi:hypothetical protein
MYSSDDLTVNNSIGNALYHATIQLAVPTVSSTGSMTTKLRSNSTSNESCEIRKTDFSLSSLSISFPKHHSHLNKRKLVRDTTPQLISHKSIAHFEPMMITSSPTTTKYYRYRQTTSCSPRKHNKSIFLKTAPKWRAFTKVVVSLLRFTRTKKDRYEWIQLVGHPGNLRFLFFLFYYSS